jgi:hypothetical protein
MALQDRDVRDGAYLFGQRLLHGRTGRVGGMDDAALAVAAFARQVEAQRESSR